MRFTFDPRKRARLRANPRRGIGFEEVIEIFSKPYWLDRRSEVPEQFVVIKTLVRQALDQHYLAQRARRP